MHIVPRCADGQGDINYEEKLYPGFQPTGRFHYGASFKVINGMRICSAVILISFAYILIALFTNAPGSNNPILPLLIFLIPFGLVWAMNSSEYRYINDSLSSRSLLVFSNGLEIPPIYFRKYTKRRGFIEKRGIDHIEIRNRKRFVADFGEKDAYAWHDAKVEFVVHLRNGRKRRSGMRPPGTIRDVVDLMKKEWGVPVVDNNPSKGYVRVIKNNKFVERRDL